ncbi:tetratricopeptide repeat protein [Clostridium gasigenes]|uniref:tetratricopeptide repeat protein n=1 Tax=Clostridium gasigenes TaxID=94869 RepID=UPI001C0CBFE9|nr:tetratricopeptide repeat protein [Clostridium gasigenes]MBU3089822.1 tetratricopeptide repeat protein [Clostridium gasigenes]
MIYNLQKPIEFFIGRDNEISKIEEKFSNVSNVVFIKGMGGIGKSEIAKAYSVKYKEKYETISYVTYNGDLESTIAGLQFSDFEINTDENIGNIYMRKLNKLKQCNRKTLLIVDNFNINFKTQNNYNEEVIAQKEKEQRIFNEFISGEYNILFTTRNYFENFKKSTIDISSISDKNILRRMFFSYYQKEETDDLLKVVDEIIRLVNGHTLTVELVAKMTKNSRRNINNILEILKVEGIKNSIRTQITSYKDNKYNEDLMYNHIKSLFDFYNNSENEKKILTNLCLVGYNGIECTQFLKWINSEEDFTDINNLINTGWVVENNNKISLHPVISEIAYRELEPNIEKCIDFLNNFVTCINNKNIKGNEVNIYLSIGKFVYKRIKDVSLELIYLYKSIASFFRDQSLLKESLKVCLEILQISKESKGSDSDIIADVYNETGIAYDLLGLNKEAYDYYRVALDIRKRLSGKENNLQIGIIYRNIACNYRDRGIYEKALEFCDYALDLQESASEKSLEIADSYELKSDIYKIYNNFTTALEYQHKALLIKKSILDKDNIDISIAYNNMASIYYEMGDSKSALDYYLQILDLFERKYYENHIFLANIYNNIGLSYQGLQDYEKAEEFLKKALSIRKEIFFSNSIEIAISYDNLGANYFFEGNLDKSLEYRLISYEIIQNIDSKETNSTINVLNNIGVIYYQKGDYNNAINFNIEALKISEKIFGIDNVNTITQYGRLGECYRVSNDIKKIELFLKYIYGMENVVKKISDKDKDLFYSACICISNYYYKLGDTTKAQIYYDKSKRQIINA